MPFKDFAAGDILTAADVDNYLMRQTVMVFADSTARDTALTGVLAEGMFCYLNDTNAFQYYDSAAWQDVSQTETMNLIRLTSTVDAGLTSTGHAFQIGADSGQNLLMDNNEILVRDNGSVSTLSIQASGGDINIGTTFDGVGFGKDASAGKVWANGVYANDLTTSYRSVYVSATGSKDYLGYVASSNRWKNNIEPLSYTAEQILAVEPKEYNYKSEAAGSPKHVGMIAEDLHEAGLTGFVSYDEEGLPGSINYEFFVAALQQVVRHQAAQIADLAARLDSLES